MPVVTYHDKGAAMVAVAQDGSKLQYAAPELRKDKDVALAAVAQDGYTLYFTALELRKDRDVVMAAVAQDGWALVYAALELRKDRDVVMAAVAQDGRALQHAAPELKKDKGVVMAAVAQNGGALQYAAPELRKDRDVVMAAVSQNGLALQDAAAELRKDRDVVMAAVAQNGGALQYAAPELTQKYGNTPATFKLAVRAELAAEAGTNHAAASTGGAAEPRPTKRQKLSESELEALLGRWMAATTNVAAPALGPLASSAFLPAYNACKRPRDAQGAWAIPIETVAQSLPWKFDRREWDTALVETRESHASISELDHAGAACAYLWSKTPMCRLVQHALLADHAEALRRLMPYIRCLNNFILDEKGLLQRTTVRPPPSSARQPSSYLLC
eukprot:COSAG01_NODE_491_length_16354_cov_26.550784_8_plen_387_part_00